MKPSIDITRDYFGVMKQATIKFGLPPNNDVDIGRLESLKDLLTVITGKPKEGYQCNNPKDLPTPYPECKYHRALIRAGITPPVNFSQRVAVTHQIRQW